METGLLQVQCGKVPTKLNMLIAAEQLTRLRSEPHRLDHWLINVFTLARRCRSGWGRSSHYLRSISTWIWATPRSSPPWRVAFCTRPRSTTAPPRFAVAGVAQFDELLDDTARSVMGNRPGTCSLSWCDGLDLLAPFAIERGEVQGKLRDLLMMAWSDHPRSYPQIACTALWITLGL